ncbi:PaaX family transcriptional regulator C-terminal domain-containing protein [Curvivirga sp.]|uniref:PaaX family transcriptional regulator n=1 Tax=Curvivirga sp. TaxID=2856848 RepID=UPI003B5B0972
MNASTHTQSLISRFSEKRPIRAGSFIITLYGDAILPRNGEVWMGDIIAFCNEVGISESLVRTAVSRLVSSNRITGSKIGRKSYYKLSDRSRTEFHHAAGLIYSPPKLENDLWTCVLNLSTVNREDLKRKMERIGFGDPIHGLFMKPGDCQNELYYVFGDSLKDYAGVTFTANLDMIKDQLDDLSNLTKGWNLDDLTEQYQSFLDQFSAIHACLPFKDDLSDLEQLLLRQILVHEYRRIIFRDPRLPAYLLPNDWIGYKAYDLFADLYRALIQKSENYINHYFENAQDTLSPNEPVMNLRMNMLKPIRS